MESFGLFTRVESRAAAPKTKLDKLPKHLSVEQLHAFGLRGVESMNPKAVTPCMEPKGAKRPAVYILGEAPGKAEDERGAPIAGSAAAFLRQCVPNDWEARTRTSNIVRTRPRGDVLPTRVQIECFRPSVEKDIEKSRPKVVLGFGHLASEWMIGNVRGGMAAVRGRKFATRIGEHDCWFIPTYHPGQVQQLLNDKDKKRERGETPAEELARVCKADIKTAYRLSKEREEPEVFDIEKMWDGITCVEGGDPEVVERFLRKMEAEPCVAFDLETNKLHPYSSGAKVLTASVGTYDEVMAFAIDHPQNKWSKSARERVLKAFERLLRAGNAKSAHNLGFEIEWLMFLYGHDIRRATKWHCTRAQAYCIDERETGQALDFLCRMRFGLDLKKQSKMTVESKVFGLALQSEEQIDRNQLEKVALKQVLRYNGLDSKFTDRLDTVQRREIKRDGLKPMYLRHKDRIPSFANAQRQGLPVDDEQVKEFLKEWGGLLRKEEKLIRKHKGVRKYEKQYGPFNPNADKQKVTLLRNVLGYKVNSASEGVLEKLDSGIARTLLRYKQLTKIKGTYIDRMMRTHPKSYVYPDGLIHPQYNTTKAATGRSTSEDPNGQNFPKRKHKQIRKQVYAGEKKVMIAVDHGQLEYRCAGMASKDPVIAKYLWEGQDVHGEWAEKIAEAAAHTLEKHKGVMKDLRNQVKNGWVFPRFFGSSWNSIFRNMNMDEQQGRKLATKFDHIFRGMVAWQKEQWEFYVKNLYVQTLTERRRRAPMNWNMVINHPIQGFGSDIVIDGMNRLDAQSLELDIPWLSPRLNVHDDLTFIVPASKADHAEELIVKGMLSTAVDWPELITLPLNVEVSIGKNWAELEPTATYQSDKLLGYPKRRAA